MASGGHRRLTAAGCRQFLLLPLVEFPEPVTCRCHGHALVLLDHLGAAYDVGSETAALVASAGGAAYRLRGAHQSLAWPVRSDDYRAVSRRTHSNLGPT